MARRKLAFVLAGGGARGALQAGALRALFEAGYRPDLICGTSIGAVNAAILSLHSATPVAALESAWRDAAVSSLVPSGFLGLTLRVLLGRGNTHMQDTIRSFLVAHGITRDLTFGALPGTPIRIVAADLRSGQTVIYGADPKARVLEGVLASVAVPLWVEPVEADDRLLLDGGAVSNLPIEPAIAAGATEIIALDLSDSRPLPGLRAFGGYAYQLVQMLHNRQAEVEMALAAARHIPVRTVQLQCAAHPVGLWDFADAPKLIEEGYAQMRAEMTSWEPVQRWYERFLPWRGVT
jgi:NTE family protein